MHKRTLIKLCALLTSLVIINGYAQEDRFANVVIEIISVNGAVSMLTGAGGNIGVSAGDDGILIIDDQYEPLSDKIKSALQTLGSDKPKFVINSHFHGDHAGGNVNFGADGVIIAHDNVRVRLVGLDTPEVALPVITYLDELSLYFNGEKIILIHVPEGHTDTDSIIHFTGSNVIHMGDHFFNGAFPFVDLESGGTVQGYMANVERALSHIADDTRVIPGHGALASKGDLQAFHEMLTSTVTAIREMKSSGMAKEAIVSQGLEDRWDSWGGGFVPEDRWIRTVFDSYPR